MSAWRWRAASSVLAVAALVRKQLRHDRAHQPAEARVLRTTHSTGPSLRLADQDVAVAVVANDRRLACTLQPQGQVRILAEVLIADRRSAETDHDRISVPVLRRRSRTKPVLIALITRLDG